MAERTDRTLATHAAIEPALAEDLRVREEDLRRREAELNAREQGFTDFVENATVGLHQVGPDGTILWANQAELTLLGYARDEYIGRSIAEFHVDAHVIRDILTRLTRGEELHNYEARLRAKDATIKHVLISSNVNTRDGKFLNTRCFTRDITERKRADEALRQREQQLQEIADALPALVAFVDADQRYRFVNAAYERWFSVSRDELVGKRIEALVDGATYGRIGPFIARALAGEQVSYQAESVSPVLGTRHVSATYMPQRAPDGHVLGFVALVSDVTERKAFDDERAASEERRQRLLKITSALADAVTPAEVFEAIVDHTGAALNATSSALWLLGDDGRALRLVRQVGYSSATASSLEILAVDMEPSIPAVDAIRRGEPVWVPSQQALVRAYPHLAGAVTPGRSYRVCCLPLMSNGTVLGTFAITSEEARDATEDERSFLLLVARHASQALVRLRLLEAERSSRTKADAVSRRMSVLSYASRSFGETDIGHDQRLDKIVREVGELIDSHTSLALVQDDGRLHAVAHFHPNAEAQAMLQALSKSSPLQSGEGLSGTVVSTGKSALIPHVDQATFASRAPSAYRDFFERFPTYALMIAPLRVRGRIIGTMAATRTRDGISYSDADLEMLEGLADRAAAAIEASRLYKATEDAKARAEQLYQFAHAAVSADRIEQVFDAALTAIGNSLNTERSALLLFDDDDVMRFRAWRGLSEDYRRAVEGHTPWPRNADAPQPVLVPDVMADDALASYGELFRRERIGSLAFIPLVSRGQLLGKFMVYYEQAHSYSPYEIELAGTIANHLGPILARFSAVAELERTIRFNELFAGVLAHDLRNPLAAIIMAAQIMLMHQEGQGDPNAKPLTKILSSGQRMSVMIDQLLDFTRSRVGGGIQIGRVATNLADLCRQAVSELEIVYPDRKFECSHLGDNDGTWDPDRLLQVISNLVANASQHGRADSPIRITVDGRESDAVRFEIQNKGTIPPTLLQTVFDPFRGSNHRHGSRGLGLGLFIVKEIVRAHGGTVQVTSTEDAGTTFTVRLPR